MSKLQRRQTKGPEALLEGMADYFKREAKV